MVITLSIIGLVLIVLLIGKINITLRFQAEVKELFAGSKRIEGKVYSYHQLVDLPEPVQRYFKLVLKEGQAHVSYARIKHDGQFKTGLDKPWINIKGEQYATTQKPGFIWKGTTSMFVARDMYIADKGRLIVSLFSVLNIVDAKGEQYNQGELLRWLGESVMYPTNLLPSDRIKWVPIDEKTAKLIFTYNDLSLNFLITFNENGEITEMETKRYMDTKTLATWLIKMNNYKEMDGFFLPTAFNVLWRLEKGDFSYAKFNIQRVEYDISKVY